MMWTIPNMLDSEIKYYKMHIYWYMYQGKIRWDIGFRSHKLIGFKLKKSQCYKINTNKTPFLCRLSILNYKAYIFTVSNLSMSVED